MQEDKAAYLKRVRFGTRKGTRKMSKFRMFYEQDCDLQKLDGKTVAIIGYGSQGHAHALNLKESGVNVIVGLYEGSKSRARAEA